MAKCCLYTDWHRHPCPDWLAVQGFFAAGDIPLLLRVAVGIIGVGSLLLIGIAVRDRMKKSKTEDFKEVDK